MNRSPRIRAYALRAKRQRGEVPEMTGPLELNDNLVIQTTEQKQLQFEVMGLIEDPERGAQYAVLYSEVEDEFVVTDMTGNLLPDEVLAQEILDDFFELVDEPGNGGKADNESPFPLG